MVPGSRLPRTSIHINVALQLSNGTEYSPSCSPQLQWPTFPTQIMKVSSVPFLIHELWDHFVVLICACTVRTKAAAPGTEGSAGDLFNPVRVLGECCEADGCALSLSLLQVMDWIENHGEAFLSKHTGVGKSLHRARALQKRHDDFEDVAQVSLSIQVLSLQMLSPQWQTRREATIISLLQ